MEMMRYKTVIRFLFSAGIFFQACESDVSCRNDDGNEVDWYILYKLPNKKDGGLSYLYMDESTNGWIRSRKTIDSNSGTLAHTLKPLLDFYDRKTEGFGYLLHNDQPPRQVRAGPSYGHSKGVVMLDRRTGVWLSHSTPKFPTYRSKDFWPKSGNANAQTFICVTYPYATFKQIGLQLKYIHPYSFDSDIPTTFPPDLRFVAQRTRYQNNWPLDNVMFKVVNLTSVKGQNFTSFAKYRTFGDDINSGLIVNHLKQDLYVKSWGTLSRPLPSNCTIPHHVYNVKKVKLPGTQTFTDTVDHSKWIVTADRVWTCIADMNREESQKGRGGGAICINDALIGDAFFSLIREREPCDGEHAGDPQRALTAQPSEFIFLKIQENEVTYTEICFVVLYEFVEIISEFVLQGSCRFLKSIISRYTFREKQDP
ncbi:deoxyribonuclease-2-alpha-like [Limanda limanda]|uniref:deoxyribonuclease-2-alpha-like n=1 Tax=Limanda limanda TaxID=27771 RepID=UPI0029C93C31|nr:deoxyribonuclease-2-alpha-like [Limanda limanda]